MVAFYLLIVNPLGVFVVVDTYGIEDFSLERDFFELKTKPIELHRYDGSGR